jgi:hypothetical protein
MSLRHAIAALAGLGILLSAAAAAAMDGRVLDAVTGAAVPDAIVTVQGIATRLQPTGAFHVDGAPDRILVRAPGYRATAVAAADLARTGGTVRLAPFTPKAVYLTVYGIGSKTLRDGALRLVKQGTVNALVIDLKGDRGIVPYPSPTAQATAPQARQLTTISDLAALARTLHANGVYLIARIVTFKDAPLAAAHPEFAIHTASGALFHDREGLAWTDPFRPEVQAYNIGLAIEAARAGFDEVQFDYLRFPDSSTKLRLAKPSNLGNRTQAIAGFLAEARRRLAPYNVFLSADVFGYVCWNLDDTGIGQRLGDIMPSVDYLSPMLYPSGFRFGIPGIENPVANSYSIVRDSLAQARARVNVSPKRFRPWLQAFRDYAFDRRLFDADEVADQIRAANDFGSDGWMLWNARNTYADTGLAQDDAGASKLASAASGSPPPHSCS